MRKELESPLKEEIKNLGDRSNAAWNEGNYEDSIKLK
jgi:hypothetical protein